MDSDDTDMEEFIKNCKMEWTILRPVEFMKNVFFQWAETIKTHNSVFTAFPDTPSARIHEMDVADVATKVLLEEGHQNQIYYLTGPEVLTPVSAVEKLSNGLGKNIQLVRQSEEETREAWMSLGLSDDYVQHFVIEMGKNPPAYTYTVTPTVEKILKKPARTFDEWVKEYKEYLI